MFTAVIAGFHLSRRSGETGGAVFSLNSCFKGVNTGGCVHRVGSFGDNTKMFSWFASVRYWEIWTVSGAVSICVPSVWEKNDLS